MASTTGRTIAGAQGLLGLVLNTAQWNAHVLNISVNDEGQQVIAQRYAASAYVELEAGMSATEITITNARNKQNSRELNDCRTKPKMRHNG